MYFTLACAPPGGAGIAALQVDPDAPDAAERDWIGGRPFTAAPTQPLRLRCLMRPGTALPALRQSPLPLMTRALRDALRSAGVSNLDCYDVEILGHGEPSLSREFVAFNLIGAVHSGPPGPGPRLSASRLDAAGARGLLLFRVADAPYALVATQALRDRLAALALDGLRFVPSAHWTG